MKHIIAIAIALLAASPMSARAGEATAAPTQLDRTQEYRIWSAEQMINRVTARLGRMATACNNIEVRAYFPKASEVCEKAVMSLYPRLQTIREIAAGGDDVLWAELVVVVRRLEIDTEAPLNRSERK